MLMKARANVFISLFFAATALCPRCLGEIIRCGQKKIDNQTSIDSAIKPLGSKGEVIGPVLENEKIVIFFHLSYLYSNIQPTMAFSYFSTSFHCFKDEDKPFQRQFRTASCQKGAIKLGFNGVKIKDSGNYTCQSKAMGASHSVSATRRLDVLRKPELAKIDLQFNTSINLTCSGHLTNSPVIWYKGKKDVQQNCTYNCVQLLIRKATFDDAGKYYCKRVNSAAKLATLKIFKVKVTDKPNLLNLTLEKDGLQIEVQENHSPIIDIWLLCSVNEIDLPIIEIPSACKNKTCFLPTVAVRKEIQNARLRSYYYCQKIRCKVKVTNKNGVSDGTSHCYTLWNRETCQTEGNDTKTEEVTATQVVISQHADPTSPSTTEQISENQSLLLPIIIGLALIAATLVAFIVTAIIFCSKRKKKETDTCPSTPNAMIGNNCEGKWNELYDSIEDRNKKIASRSTSL